MMRAIVAGSIAVVMLAGASQAFPGERDRLNACKVLVDRAPQAQRARSTPDDTELQKCRQMIREWTLRDSRMSVDEDGRPLR